MGFVEQQLDISRRVYGIDPAALAGSARAEFLWDMVAAAQEECTEIRRCYDAKPWSWDTSPTAGQTLVAKQTVAEEIADLLVFLSNLALIEGLTTEDLLSTFEYKLRQNEARHEPQPGRVGADTRR